MPGSVFRPPSPQTPTSAGCADPLVSGADITLSTAVLARTRAWFGTGTLPPCPTHHAGLSPALGQDLGPYPAPGSRPQLDV